MKIDIFYDYGESIGLGHWMRCQNLAQKIQSLFGFIDFQIHFHRIDSCEHFDESSDLIIIDSYIADLSCYARLQEKAILLICLDDLGGKVYPPTSLILAPTLGYPYKNKHSGKDYLIINEAFLQPKQTSTKPNHILISLGGSNQNQLIDEILESLQEKDFVFHIVSPYYSNPKHHIYKHLEPSKLSTLIDECEYVICAGGGHLGEILSRGKKIIAIRISSNQTNPINYCLNRSWIKAILDPQQSLKTQLLAHLESLQHHRPTRCRFGSKLDGFLIATIHSIIAQKISLHFKAKPFSLLSPSQRQIILSLRNQEGVRAMSLNHQIITAKQHQAFLRQLGSQDLFFAFLDTHTIIGVGSLKINRQDSCILGLYKNLDIKTKVGEEILKSLLLCATKILNIKHIDLEVLSINTKAIRLYQKYGFVVIHKERDQLKMRFEIKRGEELIF
ncbi:bifunctional UDP-2,4-diacetamido-2,4,6-trideoxy-beta-L-altropyranose hydrolase/GNAT family N-acetyltransferase [Helicobacter enhydrae]|uniref:bifunctional UDP-2,4-diacetamido-2,4,6-trideoxy-beta-L-altropyranose hydrolase/GNAT family N-acetyltransferase n=1 Tax=Helicobacter enhydrae TaxID=222136 RepID=UPI0019027211|nr:bifunctional UDP-2,4-diacetamido-2,4,6-trideoxy-beta-L-altropyranose hydrolase/GNAT family N-acetyltransferase [Helicobacter enhydrae]